MGVNNVGRFASVVEANFGVDPTPGIAAGGEASLDHRLVAGSFQMKQPGRKHLPDMTVLPRLHDRLPPKFGSLDGMGFTASIYLEGLPAALDSAAAYSHPQNHAASIISALMGGNSGAAGSSVDYGGGAHSATSFYVQAGHGARFSKGGALLMGGEMREIKNVAGDVITLKHALSADPADDLAVYNCASFYFDESVAGANGASLCFEALGLLAGDQWVFRGCGGSFTIDAAIDSLLKMNLDITAATGAVPGATAVPKTSGITLAGAAYVGGGPFPAIAGQVQWQDVGTTTRKILRADKFTIDPGIRIVPELALDGVETKYRYRMIRQAAKVTLEFPAYTGATNGADFDLMFADYYAQTPKMALIQIGNAPTVCAGFSFPRLNWAGPPERITGSDDGLMRCRVSMEAREDGDITTPTTAIHYSAFRVHLA